MYNSIALFFEFDVISRSVCSEQIIILEYYFIAGSDIDHVCGDGFRNNATLENKLQLKGGNSCYITLYLRGISIIVMVVT